MENTKADIVIKPLNEVYVKIIATQDKLYEISDYFTYSIENFHFMKRKNKKLDNWDGKIRLFNTFDRKLLQGLMPRLMDLCASMNYTVEDNRVIDETPINEKWLNNLKEELPFPMRDYQESSIREMVKRKRSILVSPTASGKSLMIYSLTRWALDHVGGKVLIIVPNVALVHQMEGDFATYASKSSWNVSENVQTIYSGQTKDFYGNVIISTWQSIHKLPDRHFEGISAVIGDEAHLYKARSLENILKRLYHAKIRCGTTGTLDDLKIHRLMLEGIFGKAFKVATTKTLMDQDYLSKLKIKLLRLRYSEKQNKLVRNYDYHTEVNHVVSNYERNMFLVNLCKVMKGNTLVLFNLVEKHGKILQELLEKHLNKPVYFIHGGVDAGVRDQIRTLVESKDDAVILASYGTFSTGINIKRLNNIILAGSIKSKIRTLQSIGRGLRLSEHKEQCNLYDICDDHCSKGYENYLFKHSLERLQYYYNEGFKVKTLSYLLENGKVSPYKKKNS